MGDTVDRLAAHLRSSPDAERPMAGRVGGALWVFGAGSALLLPLFPQSATTSFRLLAALCAAGVTWGLVALFAIDWRRAPGWWLPTANVVAAAFVAALTMLTGGADSPARLYALFALIYAVSFLPPWQAGCLIVLSAAAWELPVSFETGLGVAAAELIIALPIFAVLGAVILGGRQLLTTMRDAAERLSDEHDALRRLATAVAQGEDLDSVCAAASEQAARLLRADGVGILELVDDTSMTLIGNWQAVKHGPGLGSSFPVQPGGEVDRVHREGVTIRIDDVRQAGGVHAEFLRQLGYSAWIGCPIRVRGQVWGIINVVAARAGGFPDSATRRLAEFAELVGMAVANTEQVAQLNADASTDPLAGLANHRAFQDRLQAELGRADRHGRQLSVALVDIDHFKAINDAGGHGAGDEVLRAVSGHLRAHLRDHDVLARVGGDEFAVLLPETSAESAAAALERARRTIERTPFPGGARPTVSVGLCDIAHGATREDLLRFADGALYWSKEHGRNRVSVYDPATVHELSAAERLQQLQRSQALVGIRALARAIDARDPSTSEHSERVAELAARLAEERGWPSERVALLHEAALVHDVGKIGTPDAILLKPTRLTPEEFEVIKEHPGLGARIVEEVLAPEQVEWILSHHERPDGRGYPRGLTGAELSEGGALLAAADAFDVMISTRPYSPGRSIPDALEECRALVGRQFTAEAVAALEAVHGAVDDDDVLPLAA